MYSLFKPLSSFLDIPNTVSPEILLSCDFSDYCFFWFRRSHKSLTGFFSSYKWCLVWSFFSTRLGVRSNVVLMSLSGCLVQTIVTIHSVTNKANRSAEISIAVAKSRADMIGKFHWQTTHDNRAVAKLAVFVIAWLDIYPIWMMSKKVFLQSTILFICMVQNSFFDYKSEQKMIKTIKWFPKEL